MHAQKLSRRHHSVIKACQHFLNGSVYIMLYTVYIYLFAYICRNDKVKSARDLSLKNNKTLIASITMTMIAL